MKITQRHLKECVEYDRETGGFKWKERPASHFLAKRHHSIWNARYSGKVAGSRTPQGYIVISIDGRLYRAHALAILHETGVLPPLVDHKNMVRDDNRFSNIRAATRSQNGANRADVQASSGVKGVSWHKGSSKWQVRVCGKYVGMFATLQDAEKAYATKDGETFGEFLRVARATPNHSGDSA